MARRKNLLMVVVLVLVFLPLHAGAGVVDFDLVSRGLVADGASFGAVGPYEKLTGQVVYEIDPASPHNQLVVDLDKAPTTAEGVVRYSADIYILRPARPGKGNGAVVLEVCNRGGKAVVRYFNRQAARTVDPVSAADFGDGFLMRHGFTLVWIGWQFDVPERDGLLRLHPPTAIGADGPIRGRVRADAVFTETTDLFPLGHRDHRAYAVAEGDEPSITLTVRDSRLGERRRVPSTDWRLARRNDSDEIVPSADTIYMPSGFVPGKIYEAVYEAEDPVVVGLGLTAVRDLALALKHHPETPVRADRVLAIGISQTGRFLRHLLYQSFNHDENGRLALDAVWAHTAGAGRGSFNHRFAQPSRDAHAYSAFFYPTDIFPFSAATQTDSMTGRAEGLMQRSNEDEVQPKAFFTNTGYEYWGRAAALIHTSLDGTADLPCPENLRLYHFASTQHFVGAFPPQRSVTRYPNNPADFFWILRSLLIQLDAWVADDEAPPASRVPRIADGTLVARQHLGFPPMQDVFVPEQPHQAYRMDYGPRFLEHGIVEMQPPRVGTSYATLLPAVDIDGNEIGGLRLPEIVVPIATYTPWNLRAAGMGAGSEMADFRGGFFPFPRTEQERRESRDPRRSLENRYPTRAHYLGLYALASVELVDQGFILAEDVPGLLRRAEALWALVQEEP